jgi:hypothetical protein
MPPVLVVGVGAMRAGSTSLHRYLAAHPDVRVTRRKEVHYFDRNHDRGEAWYREQFDGPPARWDADVSPNYMYEPAACERIAAVDGVRVVAVLRDPVERAYSHYLQKRSYGTEPLTFGEAIDAEAERLSRSERDRSLYSYVDRGFYLRQLLPYERALGRDALHVMLLDDVRARPAETWSALCAFLDIAAMPPLDEPPANRYVEFRSPRLRTVTHRLPAPLRRVVGRANSRRVPPQPMREADRKRLRARYAEEVDCLSDWLGRDLRALWWS